MDRFLYGALFTWLLSCAAFVWLRHVVKPARQISPANVHWSPATIDQELNNGWTFLPLEKYLAQRQVIEAMEYCEGLSREWVADFIRQQDLESIRNRNAAILLGIAATLTNRLETPQSIELRRKLTISAIVYSFPIPTKLYYFDDIVAGSLHCYLVHHKLTDVESAMSQYQDERIGQDMTYYDSESLKRFFALTDLIPAALKLVAMFERKKYPNLAVLCVYLRSSDAKLMEQLQALSVVADDPERSKHMLLDNIKMWLTLSFGKMLLPIPRDYLSVNDFVVEYLRDTRRYPRPSTPTLKVI